MPFGVCWEPASPCLLVRVCGGLQRGPRRWDKAPLAISQESLSHLRRCEQAAAVLAVVRGGGGPMARATARSRGSLAAHGPLRAEHHVLQSRKVGVLARGPAQPTFAVCRWPRGGGRLWIYSWLGTQPSSLLLATALARGRYGACRERSRSVLVQAAGSAHRGAPGTSSRFIAQARAPSTGPSCSPAWRSP